MIAKQGVHAIEVEARYKPQDNADLVSIPAGIIMHILERPRRPVPCINFSGERKDWPTYKTRAVACAENVKTLYTLDRIAVDMPPSNGIVLNNGNPEHAKYIKVVEDCA